MRSLPLALAVAVTFVSCHEHGGVPDGVDELAINCDDAKAGETVVSDETYRALVEAEAAKRVTKEDCRAPELQTPAAGTMLDPDAPPTFTFRSMRGGCTASVRPSAPTPRRRAWWRALSPVGVAWAHCPAVTGENYWLRLWAPDGTTPIYSALLSINTFTPSAAIWSKALGAQRGKSVKVTLQRAVFVRGSIMEGPFEQKEGVPFQVRP